MENINYPQTLDQCIEKFSSADTWDAFNGAITESKAFIESDEGESNPFLAQACGNQRQRHVSRPNFRA